MYYGSWNVNNEKKFFCVIARTRLFGAAIDIFPMQYHLEHKKHCRYLDGS